MAKSTYPTTGVNTPAARAQRETHWRRLIDRWKTSGLTKTAFCEREGHSGAALHWWIGEIDRRDHRRPRRPAGPKLARAARTSFVPVRVVTPAPSAPRPIEVLVAGHVIRVVPDFDPETFRRIVHILEGWPTLAEVSGRKPC
jgi:hypothetical protein